MPAGFSESAASTHDASIRRAIELSRIGMSSGAGGPFGAVVVRGDMIVGEGYNRVIRDGDPTAHAEIVAIRAACRHLGTFELSGCVLYTSCQPCPMCLGAALWSRISLVWYANTADDAQSIGFDDSAFYEDLHAVADPPHIRLRRIASLETLGMARRVFDDWFASPGRQNY